MEVFYLLCSILSTFVTSLTLSLLLPFRSILRRRDGAEPAVHLYEGTVWHQRRRPVHHSFRYSVRYALIDLDHASHPPPDHLSADECRSVAGTDGPVFLLTIPPSVGYEQNPLSVYYCYAVEGSTDSLKKCIAEVTNTPWGERASFLFNPKSDSVAKPLHVSPFMDMLGNWIMRTDAPGDNLFIRISVQHPKLGDYFTATLTAKRISSLASDHALFFWLMPHKVALRIYWQALKLWWKGVSFIQHPRYSNLEYRQEALIRDRKLPCCLSFLQDVQNHVPLEGSDSDYVEDDIRSNRWFTWRDAKWPWS
ncbi:hypothetical protein U1Q18_010332 [Sarracenia purpurea var. burkii]